MALSVETPVASYGKTTPPSPWLFGVSVNCRTDPVRGVDEIVPLKSMAAVSVPTLCEGVSPVKAVGNCVMTCWIGCSVVLG